MDKISTSKQNILQYIDSKGITKSSFYEVTGISPSNFKGKGLTSELGSDKLAKILSCYPDVNIEWVLTGKGKMLKQTTNNYTEQSTHTTELKEPDSYWKKKTRALEISIELMSQEIQRLRNK